MTNASTAKFRSKGALRCGAAFALAFLLGTSSISWLAELGERASARCADDVAAKRRWFAEHKDEYDAVFLGTSRIYRHVNPAVFDGVLGGRGRPFRSFNFGVPSMNWIEALQTLEFIADLQPARLEYIFLDPLMDLALKGDNLESSRNLRASELKYALLAVRTLAGSPLRRAEKAQQIGFRLRSWASNLLNLSRVSRLQSLWMDETLECVPWRPDEPGFVPLDADRGRNVAARRARYLGALDEYRTRVERACGRHGGEPEESGPSAGLLHELAVQLTPTAEGMGVRPVFVIGATLVSGSCEVARRLERDPGRHPVLSFADPERYPELFAADLRWDPEHHSLLGANEFSRQLAERFLREVAVRDAAAGGALHGRGSQ